MTAPNWIPPRQPLDAAGIVALHADADRHPNALAWNLTRTLRANLVALATPEFGPGICHTAADLVEMARVEISRRDEAMARLLGDNPSLVAAMRAQA